jgi:lysozyme
MPHLATPLLTAVLVLAGVTACGAESESSSPEQPSVQSSPSPSADRGTRPSPSPRETVTRAPRPRLVRGVDASHHQGAIDWARVRRDRMDFAYLKASEGSTFVDPRFVSNARAASAAGLRVGGYHYFSTCSPGAPQGEHFVDVLASAGAAEQLPPAIDLELQGNCAQPPPREELLAEVRAFMKVVERATGRRMVVYAYPDFEARYRFAPVLDRRQWVRRIGNRPPDRQWWIWQKDDRATVEGFSAPADLNLMRRGGP